MFEQALENFIASDDFPEALRQTTILKWRNPDNCMVVELFVDGTYRLEEYDQIGNKYETSGILLHLPGLADSDYQECVTENNMEEGHYFLLAYENQREEIIADLREDLKGEAY